MNKNNNNITIINNINVLNLPNEWKETITTVIF